MSNVKHFEFKNYRKFETTFAGRPLVVETGKMAQLANGSCLVTYGETAVLVTATASAKPRDGIDFFPLSVDFEERLYAVGRIPGSFMRREGRPSEKAILSSRQIDRPMRPLFPKDLRNDVSIVCTVMQTDYDNSPEVVALLGASIAVSISDIPFDYVVGGCQVGIVDGKTVINPTVEQRKVSEMDVTLCATADKIVMIEAGANEVPEEQMFNSLMEAHEEIKKVVAFIADIKAQIGKPKFEYEQHDIDHDLFDKLEAECNDKFEAAMDTDDKTVRDAGVREIVDAFEATLSEEYLEEHGANLPECVDKLQKKIVRRWLANGKRVDGRGMEEIRPLASEVGVLSRAHGSGMFTRGQTQVLTICTLGTMGDAQELDTIFEEKEKRYIHHYNFPSFSVGETRPSRGPGRREIGHGALAERALLPVIPSAEEFPYAMRLVSEVISSNGSTSQGSVCGSTLALMDAGVPIKAPVAGISCGLITDGGQETTFTDIQGVEDFYGDMDFKVAGTKKGITAIQVDIKVDGLTPNIIKEAFRKCKVARYEILDEVMLKAIDKPRADVSDWAPKMTTMQIDPDKIREVIGKGGSVIQKIVAESGAQIDISDEGVITIAAVKASDANVAKQMIEAIVKEPEVGEIYYGKVVRLMNFGAFVNIMPNKDGMVHISKMADHRIEKVEDAVNVGDMVWVKITEIDDKGRINLSMKDVKDEEKVL
ncbi:MAG TPA: polyribonucleotide nucleotidyltransferase [Candidatus Butyricicoccus avistercoris]|uniref:Polyribonucleotide nucleotidyltransferase n=1 Tax=Candidatus Butyricicoccus avistercoris TaxID=2838518 RepID=A0A9D1PJL1_9FIRM|nr:polyribonucleotide nucleotidyltransferase [Candidatus Butyricicoccus avistercoris]